MRSPLLLVVSAVIAIPLIVAPPASAGATDPQVGECFDLTIAQASADLWPDVPPVPCTSAHAVEIVKASPLPADVDAVDFSRANCSYAEVLALVGINTPVDGVIANPIRMGSFPLVVSGDGVPANYVCAVGALRYNGAQEETFVPLTSAAAALTAAQRASLRMCTAVVKGRAPNDRPLSVPCSRSPHWQAFAWVDLGHFFASYPGDKAAMARLTKLCPRATFRTVPSASTWEQGYQRGWCWKKYA